MSLELTQGCRSLEPLSTVATCKSFAILYCKAAWAKVVSSKLPRFSDMYTLTIASADPQSISAKSPVELTKSVYQGWSSCGGAVFWKDVEALIFDYAKEKQKEQVNSISLSLKPQAAEMESISHLLLAHDMYFGT
nr:probable signal peptidase complex subunit 2 [Ipomoea batatas]